MLSLSRIAKAHGTQPLFSDVSLQLPPGRRVALIGGNGTGKTTLLEIAVGLQEPDRGDVSMPRGLRLGYLPQDVTDITGGTVLEQVLRGADEVERVRARLEQLEGLLSDSEGSQHEQVMREYGHLQDRFATLGGYEIEAEAQRVMAGLGFAPDDGQRQVDELSGGWRVRVALARLLLSRPDVLILDEPTNHLDLSSIRWLESTLAGYPGAILFVSHDRDFIDAVAERIIELAFGTATEYVTPPGELGPFDTFLALREERLNQLEASRAQQQREVARTERFIERFRYKASKAKQVQSRIKMLEKLDRVEVPEDHRVTPDFRFPAPQRSGRVVAELEGIARSYGERTVLSDVDVVIERGWKIAVVGPNGAGKTTLVRMLTGDLAPDRGTVTLGHNVDVATFAQHQAETLDLDRTVLAEFSDGLREEHRGKNVRTMLGAFGFPGDLAERRVGELSGGEQTRLALAKVMASPVNLLVLDEPTNHLDLHSRDVLEDALAQYPGTVLLITHDRHVIREVADHVLEVREGRAVLHAGGLEDVTWSTGVDPATGDRVVRSSAGRLQPAPLPARHEVVDDRQTPTPKRAQAEHRNARYRATKELRRKVERYERQLEAAESDVADLTRALADPAVYQDEERVKRLVRAHAAAKDLAASLTEAWEGAMLELEDVEARLS